VAAAANAAKDQRGARAYQVLDEDGEDVYSFPPQPTPLDYALHPLRGFKCFCTRLVSNFGPEFVCMIGYSAFSFLCNADPCFKQEAAALIAPDRLDDSRVVPRCERIACAAG
jgi:hypothetical protein